VKSERATVSPDTSLILPHWESACAPSPAPGCAAPGDKRHPGANWNRTMFFHNFFRSGQFACSTGPVPRASER
jgi:hypothetical protein